jgi:uncharacterized protein (DUF427 family)
MALTIGTGPFGQHPAGRFNFEAPRKGVIYLEESPRWVRGLFGGQTVVDSRRVRMLHESGHLPIWYFPLEDVRMDLLQPTDHSTHCPFKGQAAYWSVVDGERVAENAAWAYPEPIEAAAELSGLVAFYFDRLDEWLEEDEPVLGHPRDPYHRIDVRETSRHVTVRLDGELLAETTRAKVLFEAGLPPRWYIPREDVRRELLEKSETRTTCAYKGHASYWSLGEEDDLVWTYEEPLHDAREVKDRLAFFNERVDLEVDGEPQERPITQWSRR